MLFLFLLSPSKADCGDPLHFRDSIPVDGAINVSPYTHPFLSFVGDGDVSELTITLSNASGDAIPASMDGACYLHESDTEFHCNWSIVPSEPLQGSSQYTISAVKSDGSSPSGWSDISFTTNSSTTISVPDAPILEMTYFGPRNGIGVDECDWQDASSYEFLVTLSQSANKRGLIDVFDVSNTDPEYVHTLFVASNQTVVDFRQVVTPGTEEGRCYYVTYTRYSGEESAPSDTLCHDGSAYGEQTLPELPPEPAAEPTSEPTSEPTAEPTSEPTTEPTSEPTAEPTSEPNEESNPDDSNSQGPKGGTEISVESGGCGGGSALLLLPFLCLYTRSTRTKQL
ncbi:MAG: PT domain-containing protein [Myxococcota bacterium]|nr:PT domain-containing protein [Myxococcota bacterium]